MKQRKLKVYRKYFGGKNRIQAVPEIRLCGKWLGDAGYNAGGGIIIEVRTDKIVIRHSK